MKHVSDLCTDVTVSRMQTHIWEIEIRIQVFYDKVSRVSAFGSVFTKSSLLYIITVEESKIQMGTDQMQSERAHNKIQRSTNRLLSLKFLRF